MSGAGGGKEIGGEGVNGYRSCPKPLGLETIMKLCSQVYPDQPNPLQVTALVKYWLGGPDPLDYINIYSHPGCSKEGKVIPPHWHYVSCGFSDLHGDDRVHQRAPSSEQPSGFGFELSFRLLSESIPFPTTAPPTWPAELLQNLARYVFSSGHLLCVGDHISWHSPLDQQESRIQHMLLAPDPHLTVVKSAFGSLHFIQIVGVTADEVSAAQAWNGIGILNLMKTSPMCGGELLVTDMRRGESLFEVVSGSRDVVDCGVEQEGSLLSAVSAMCGWEGVMSAMSLENELCSPSSLNGAHLMFNMEAMRLWPLAIRGRLNHGHHFTFRSVHGDIAITLIGAGVEGSFATDTSPLVAHGLWLQVYLGKQQGKKILKDLDQLLNPQTSHQLPLSLEWRDLNLKVTVVA